MVAWWRLAGRECLVMGESSAVIGQKGGESSCVFWSETSAFAASPSACPVGEEFVQMVLFIFPITASQSCFSEMASDVSWFIPAVLHSSELDIDS